MDDLVKAAMLKWPNVPHCYGWLGLDARGNWYMRDAAAQARGAFNSGMLGAKGSALQHDKLISFINRNYTHDELGQWYFQNGPQRVFVELEVSPYIWQLSSDFSVTAHTGASAVVHECLVDAAGRVYLVCDLGFGLVHSLDVDRVAQALEQGHWQLSQAEDADLAQRYDFEISPQRRWLAAQEHS